MYNLFVSGSSEDWEGAPFDIDAARCVKEYTDDDVHEKYGSLNTDAVSELRRLPCVFAYESGCQKPPKFGVIKAITKRQGRVRIEYGIEKVEPFLTHHDLETLAFGMDIGKWEMNRTHWAVKNVDLAKEVKACGVTLPYWASGLSRKVDIRKHTFDVALSFPGEARSLVEEVAYELESLLGPNAYFYDNNYISQLAQPSLDGILQDLSRNRAKLVVVFLSGDYQKKEWCGIEFRAIKEIIMKRQHSQIMLIKMDDEKVDGVFATDGYIDARKYSAGEIARFIQERVEMTD